MQNNSLRYERKTQETRTQTNQTKNCLCNWREKAFQKMNLCSVGVYCSEIILYDCSELIILV